jgi:hypothetical protein
MVPSPKLPLVAGLLLAAGIALGGTLALGLRAFTEAGQGDPCFGFGELISTRTFQVTDGPTSVDELPGMGLAPGQVRELRECRVSPIERVTIDAESGYVLGHDYTLDEALAYYQQHPDEMPSAVLKRQVEAERQQEFVSVDAAELESLLAGGCDQTWTSRDFPDVGLRVCHPSDWLIDDSTPNRVFVTTRNITLNIHSIQASTNLECDSPLSLSLSSGSVQVCAKRHQFGGKSHHFLLPSGVKEYLFVSDEASIEEHAAAFRAAMSVDVIP